MTEQEKKEEIAKLNELIDYFQKMADECARKDDMDGYRRYSESASFHRRTYFKRMYLNDWGSLY